MKRSLKIIGIILAILIALIAIWYVDNAVYPFTARNPNYSHVEAAYSKIQFPSDWQVLKTTEEKSVAGRDCPLIPEGTCFYKAQNFKLSSAADTSKIIDVLKTVGCSQLEIDDITSKFDNFKTVNYNCMLDDVLRLGATYDEERSELYVSVSAY